MSMEKLMELCGVCKGRRSVALQWPDELVPRPVDGRECRACDGLGQVPTEAGLHVITFLDQLKVLDRLRQEQGA